MCDFLHLNVKHRFALENDLQSTNKRSVAQLCPTLCGLMGRLFYPWDAPSKITGGHCHAHLQGILLTQGLNLVLLCLLQADFLAPTRNPNILLWKWKVKVMSLSHVQLFSIPWSVAHKAPQSKEFSRQEYWSGLPFPSPGDLPDPGIKPRSPEFIYGYFSYVIYQFSSIV